MNVNHLSEHWLLSAFLCIVLSFGLASETVAQNKSSVTIQGVIRDEATGEPVAGAQVWIANSSFGTISDPEGRYSITYEGKYASF